MFRDPTLLWIPATLFGAAAQVARNAMQRHLTETIGTVGATQVRFLYGFPFAVLFLIAVLAVTGEAMPRLTPGFAGFLVLGAATQVLATALMLAAMRQRSFSVVTALMKTEPVQLAVFGALALGDRLSGLAILAIATATAGVLVASWTPKVGSDLAQGGWRPVVLGLAAGSCFAISVVGFRGAILALGTGGFLPRATTTLVWGLGFQTILLLIWSAAFDRVALLGTFREWRSSLTAGFVGSLGSQLWFIGFALTAAVNVRTLALVEVVMAQVVSRQVMRQKGSRRELVGIALILVGVLALLSAVG